MEYNRKQTSLEPIDILKFDTVETGAVFKQYDINTSILELELVANGEPVHLKDEKVYVTVKSSNSLSTQLLSKYSGASVKEKDNYKVLLRAKKSRRRDVNNIIDVYISPLALENSGEMIAEVMIIDLIKEERITSQSFTFEIKPSITPNRPSESAYKIVKDLDGTYITDAEDVQLLVAEVEPNFKLSFVGTRVNEILEKANNFDVEDNTNKIQALQEKDVELESKISNLEKKDSSLDGEIASLKSSDQNIEEEIQGLKAKDESIESEISQLKSKDTAIDGEIDKLKNADETIKSDINSKYEELKQKTDATNNEIMKLKAQDTTLGESIRTNKGLIDVINPKVSTLEQDNQNVKNRVSVLEGDMNLAKSNISSLQSSNTELSQKVEGVEQGNASIDKILKQLQSDVERYKSSIELLESKVPVWKDFKGESFKVEDSFYGKSKDLSIKGRTLNNLIKDGEGSFEINKSKQQDKRIYTFKPVYGLVRGKRYVGYVELNDITNVASGLRIYGWSSKTGVSGGYITCAKNIGINKFEWNTEIFPEDVGEIDTIYLYVEGNEFNDGGKLTFSNFMMFEEGTNISSIDKYFKGVKSLGELEDNNINILSRGKNLIDFKEVLNEKNIEYSLEDGSYDFYTNGTLFTKGIYLIHGNDNNQYSISCKAKLKTATSFRIGVVYTDGSFNNSNICNSTEDFVEVEVVSNPMKQLRMIRLDWSKPGNLLIKDFQIEINNSATEYEEYKQYKRDVSLQSLGFDGGLNGLNNLLYDEINGVKGIAEKRIGTSLIDETMEFHIETQNDTHISFYTEIKGMKPDTLYTDVKAPRNSLSSNMLWIKRAWDVTDKDSIGLEGYAVSNANSRLYIRVEKLKLSSVDVQGFKNLLKSWKEDGNPFILYYELKKSVVTPLNKDINFDTLDDMTYVSLENNIKNELSCQCQVSLASVSKA